MTILKPFRPFPGLKNPHVQTILAHFLPVPGEPRFELKTVALDDDDRCAYLVTTPANWRPGDTTALLVHGLTGSDTSSYCVRAAAKLAKAGIRAVRFNMRGQGRGAGLARKPYYAGCSADVRATAEALRADDPGGRLIAIGYSLGGNAVLKMAGELGSRHLVDGVIAICPAADLNLCVKRIMQPRNRLYQRRFVTELRQEAHARQALYPEPDLPIPEQSVTLFEYDDRYTSTAWGYDGADDYYFHASAVRVVEAIEVSTHVLIAEDDPIIDPAILDRVSLPKAVAVHRVAHGGHLGFIGSPGRFRWLDDQVLRWATG